MRHSASGLVLLAGLMGLLGCTTADKTKPPLHPEEFLTPPTQEARFTQPVKYPKEVMEQDPLRKASKRDPAATKFLRQGTNANNMGSNF